MISTIGAIGIVVGSVNPRILLQRPEMAARRARGRRALAVMLQ
jgi:hypothetical protein